MKKYILSYDTESGMETLFFQTDKSLQELGLLVGVSILGGFANDSLKKTLYDLFGIKFENGETVLIEKIPEEFKTI